MLCLQRCRNHLAVVQFHPAINFFCILKPLISLGFPSELRFSVKKLLAYSIGPTTFVISNNNK